MSILSNYHHAYNLFFTAMVVSVLSLRPAFSIYASTLSGSESLTISSNRTIVSVGGDFELGFFRPTASFQGSDRWYLGIWYKTIRVRTYVWVANRDNPLSSSSGTLKISGINLVLLNQSNIPIWSTNLSGAERSLVIAELLDTGNFVLRDSKANRQDRILWQSFDHPTDTLLPHMKLGLDLKTGDNRFLRPWKNSYDPSSGNYSYKLEIQGLPEFFIWKNIGKMVRIGPWDGIKFSGLPDMQVWNYNNIVNNFTENNEEVAYTFRVTTPKIYSRLIMNYGGLLQLFTWDPKIAEWYMYWISSFDECDIYQTCTSYASCDANRSPFCSCIKGFEQKNLEGWLSKDGPVVCVRKTNLSCSGDGFTRLRNMELPDSVGVTVDRKIGLKECEEICLRNCNCTAFANSDIRDGGSGCVIWTGELNDMRNFANAGQDLYIRLAPADLDKTNEPEEQNKIRRTIGLTVGAIVLLFLGIVISFFWKRKRMRARRAHAKLGKDYELPFLEFNVIAMATNDFSDDNKLGEGGFGSVYRGKLRDGEDIAVKRLSEVSSQGATEFTNEMKSIARLQHINLVRLVGCYADGKEKMLVYEYLENRSLDKYIFDKTKGRKLHWKNRYEIINGIARGLLYLHQDSRCRVIHRDLKPSNILLDKNMIPKISDFGMARIFASDETEAITQRIVGTYGYMSPEYAMGGVYSIKSDIFSFGVLLLEIVTGRRNRGFYGSNLDNNLVSYAWRNWHAGKEVDIVDPVIPKSLWSSFKSKQASRCIKIGLLCVQDQAENRPTTASMVVMLGSDKVEIPEPCPPRFCLQANSSSGDSSSSNDWTANEYTKSVIEGR